MKIIVTILPTQWGFKEIDNENPNQIFGQNKYDNSS